MGHKCNICLAGEVGRTWTKDLVLNDKEIHEACAFFKMTPEDVQDHIDTHDFEEMEDPAVLDDPEYYDRELLKLFRLFKDWMKYCITNGNPTKADVDLAMKLGKEMRETIKTLGEFRGKLNRNSSVNVNVAIINQKYMALTKALTTEVCPECRLKVINLLDSMEDPEPIKIISNT